MKLRVVDGFDVEDMSTMFGQNGCLVIAATPIVAEASDLTGVSASLQRPASVERVAPVIVLNGGSSSGKTSIARCLQRLLGPTCMTLGVDDLVRALSGGDEVDDLIRAQQDGDEPVGTQGLIEFGPDGSVTVGDDFRRAEAPWYAGLAAIGRGGTGLILDEVFMGGRSSQERLASALAGLPVVWVGVRCDPEVAAARERGRSDRVGGMARLQAAPVHEGVVYDLVVDTTATDCASAIASHLSDLDDGGVIGGGAFAARPV